MCVRRVILGSLLSLAVGPALVRADTPTTVETPAAVRAKVADLFRDLDSPRFGVRAEAASQFEQLLSQPELAGTLALAIHETLVRPAVSYEVHWRLEQWAKRLPRPLVEPPIEAQADEIATAIKQLEADDYGVRLGALKRIRWLLRNPRLVTPAMALLKHRLADPALSEDMRHRCEDAYQAARVAWLLMPEAQRDQPVVGDGELERWIDEVARFAGSARIAEQVVCSAAERELLDVLARDAEFPRVAAILGTRLAEQRDGPGRNRLQALFEMTRPAMVAEYWSGRHHQSEQHLLIGVPSQSLGAARPSHFDRIDDEKVHCVSGNTLQPGDYPANVAIPHPLTESAFFHLVNLSTPRRRMAYTYQVNADETQRLAQISHRTLDRYLRDKDMLNEAQLVMLAQLDAKEVSRFASAYVRMVDDGPLGDDDVHERLGGRPSRLGLLCAQLAQEGTKEAVPGLVEAIAKNRFRPPTANGPYRMQWLAALAIAGRDPWPDVETWLAGQLENCEMLVEDQRDNGPEVGATAAALLLTSRGEKPAHHGLEMAADAVLMQVGVNGYRFASTDARWKVIEWWRAIEAPQRQP